MTIKASDVWIVYIIQTSLGTLYTGITNNLERRLTAHKNHVKGARYFHLTSPDKVVFSENHPNRSEASKREIAIKKMSRKDKLALTASLDSQAT